MADITMTFGCWKSLYQSPRKEVIFESGDTVKSFTIDGTGTFKRIVFEMPVFSGAVVTGTVSIENADENEIYAKSGMAEDAVHVELVSEPVVGENTVKVTLSTDPLSSGTCYLTFYAEG